MLTYSPNRVWISKYAVMTDNYKKLEKRLGYRFKKNKLLQTALTHPSFSNETGEDTPDNQRLEFLGDAMLGAAIAAYLYKTCPDLAEGDMTRQRSRITNRDALLEISREISIQDYIRLGKGVRQTDAVLSDAVESVLGAAYEDGGYKAVQKVVKQLFIPYYSGLDSDEYHNPKGALQEWCQKHLPHTPHYRVTEEMGPPHDRHYTVDVYIGETRYGRGEGRNRRQAEKRAAIATLTILKVPTDRQESVQP